MIDDRDCMGKDHRMIMYLLLFPPEGLESALWNKNRHSLPYSFLPHTLAALHLRLYSAISRFKAEPAIKFIVLLRDLFSIKAHQQKFTDDHFPLTASICTCIYIRMCMHNKTLFWLNNK